MYSLSNKFTEKVSKSLLHKMRKRAVADYEEAILDALEPCGKLTSILDCGCDDGTWTITLGKRLGAKSLSGIEIVEDRRVLAVEKGIDARHGNLNKRFPFSESVFDVVHANQVIEHLADTDSFIEEIWRVLKPHGYAIICTENLASWHNIFALMLGWQPFSLSNVSKTAFQIGNPLAIHNGETVMNPKSWQHLRVFAYRGLKEIFGQHAFSVVSCRGAGYYPFPSRMGRFDPRHAAFLTIKVRKKLGEPPTKKQAQNFPHIKELLCPVEIAQIVPSPHEKQAEKTTTKNQHSVFLVNENNLLALKDQNDRAVHIVFPDRKSGDLRICRNSMLYKTYGSQPPEWEVVGRVANAKYYVEGVEKLGRRYCRECLGHLPTQTNRR